MKVTSAILVATLLVSSAIGQEQIAVRGSDAMVFLAQRWAQRLQQIFPAAALSVNGGGPNAGAAALASGRAQIAQMPRQLSAREREAVEARTGHPVLVFPVAIESVLVAVNAGNPVSELSIRQLREIYTGKITNWKEVGGRDEAIHLTSLESAVGGSLFFREVVLGDEEFETTMRGFTSTKQLMQAVSSDRGAIGFGSISAVNGTKLVKIHAAGAAVEPSTENVRSGRYPLSRYLYWAVVRPLPENLRKISNWVLSTEGQLVVESIGYYPLNATDRAKATGEIAQAK
ncbi:MAG TPA: substrate-binding domain-containing protein [candidate division Zixibacteria bacterium]|nr:substrate-binding domain-containing protein [candidate division Zixibacteria bacterium]